MTVLDPNVSYLLDLVRDLTDPGPCSYDHHGNCQAHSLDPAPCPHERARTLLEGLQR